MSSQKFCAPPPTEKLVRLMHSRLKRLLEPSARYRSTRKQELLRNTLGELRGTNNSLYLFGGVLRDMLLGTTPRDIDMVVRDEVAEYLDKKINDWNPRRNRYGGLNFVRDGWEFDLWPLGKTWAYHNYPIGKGYDASFETLPMTTFLNVEAVAVELWPSDKSGVRQVHEHGFFKAFRTRTVEINYEKNPAPEYCIVRSLLVAQKLYFKIGPKLVNYIAKHADWYTLEEFYRLQARHYGKVSIPSDVMKRWLEVVQNHSFKKSRLPLSLPVPCVGQQLDLFDNYQLSIWSSYKRLY